MKIGVIGEIDLICTPKREYVFLEINPNGQYLWTEEYRGVPITEGLIDLLTEGVEYDHNL